MPHPVFPGTDLAPPNEITDTPAAMPSLIFHSLPRPPSSSTTSAVIRLVLASRSDQPNAFGERTPVPTALNIYRWDHLLRD